MCKTKAHWNILNDFFSYSSDIKMIISQIFQS